MSAPDLDALGTRLTELHELAWRSPTGLEKAIAVGIVQELITTSQSLIAEVRELTRQNAEFAGTNTSLMNDLVQMGMARDEAERQRDEARAALEWYGDRENWRGHNPLAPRMTQCALDEGRRARAALDAP